MNDSCPVAMFTLDAELKIVEINELGIQLFKEKKSVLVDKLFTKYLLQQDKQKFKLACINLIESRQRQSCEVRLFLSGENITFLRLDLGYLESMGKTRIIVVASDITYQKLIEDTQAFLLGYSWATEKRDYFQVLAQYLSVLLKADYVCIDRLLGNQVAETVAVFYDGQYLSNETYSIKDSPGGKVVGNTVSFYPSAVRVLFPKSTLLQNISAESYIGITLWGSKAKPIGLIEVISRKPIKDTKVSEMILKQVSIRTAAELEYRRNEKRFTALGKSSHAMLHSSSEKELLHQVCEIITKDCGYTLMWIGIAGTDENKRVMPVASAGFEEGYLETLNITWEDKERGRGPTGTAIRIGKPVICNNTYTDPNFLPWRNEAIKRGYASSAAIPLIENGNAFGGMMLYASETDFFDDEEITFLTELANNLAHGITAIRLRTLLENNHYSDKSARIKDS